MARVRFLDQVPVGFYDVDNGGGGNPGGPFSSIQYNDGGTLNGDSDLLWDRNTNTVLLTGSIIATSFTGSLFGTSSWAQSSSQALTASYVLSASYALSSSQAATASYVVTAQTASYVLSASYALSSSQSQTASYVNPLNQNVIITGSLNTSGSVFFPSLVTSSTAVTNVVMYGTNGQLFTTASTAIGGGSTPGLPLNSIQYNDGGTLNGDSNLLWDNNTGTVLLTGSLSNGSSSIATGLYSHAEGLATQAIGDYSHAEGRRSIASGSYSHAEGTDTIAYGRESHAEGVFTTASGLFSHAEGLQTVTYGQLSHAEGNQTIAYGVGSHAEGSNTTASGSYSHAEGIGTISSGDYQHAQGMYNITSSITGAFILGNGTVFNRSNLIFAAGNQVQITGSLNTSGSVFFPTLVTSSTAVSNVVMYGTNGQLFITASSAIGGMFGDYVTTASFNAYTGSNISQFAGTASFAQTASYVLSASYALSASQTDTASYVNPLNQNVQITGSLSNGFNSIAYGAFSHAEGSETIASGSYSHAEGTNTQAIGTASHAEGALTVASGNFSHAEGYNTITYGVYSHAEGDSTFAYGISSHAEGLNTIASGSYSHAEGQNTTASGDFSHAEGIGTITSASYQHAQGMYNITSPITGAFILGNGTDLNNRSNLILAYGNQVQITGSLSVTNTFLLDGNLIDSSLISPTIAGSNILFTQATGSYTSAHGRYTVYKGANSRAGEFVTAWNGTTTSYYDNSTADIGITTDVSFTSSIVTGQIQINAGTITPGWTVKMLVTYL